MILGCLVGCLAGGCDPAYGQTGPAPSGVPSSLERPLTSRDDFKLHQLLYDYEFNEPLSTLGQEIRILIWLNYMDFSAGQERVLLGLARKFKERHAVVDREQDLILRAYEVQAEPVYREIREAILEPAPDEAKLAELARRLQGVQLATRRDDELHALRIRLVRSVLSDSRELLGTLSPLQEEKLITSLFFLRHEIDPFANPGTYRSVVGSTWNAGDFTSLVRQDERRERQLDIGGLWSIDLEEEQRFNYSNIKRSIILFFVLKEPALIPVLERQVRP